MPGYKNQVIVVRMRVVGQDDSGQKVRQSTSRIGQPIGRHEHHRTLDRRNISPVERGQNNLGGQTRVHRVDICRVNLCLDDKTLVNRHDIHHRSTE